MGKKKPTTPRSRIKAAIRQLSLRSRERAATLKRDNYTCVRCGAKQSRAKGKEVYVEAHHIDGINWERVYEVIYKEVLVPPEKQQTLCKECHEEEK